MEKALLNVKEVSEYLGIGETKTRELLRNPTSSNSGSQEPIDFPTSE